MSLNPREKAICVAVLKRKRKQKRNTNLWWGCGWSSTHKWMKEEN